MDLGSLLAAWLGGFTLVYTPGVVQNSYEKNNNNNKIKEKILKINKRK